MAKLFYGSILSGNVKIHYYRTGEEKPAVVLLHGITDEALCWTRLAVALAPAWDVVMPDARGHGLSDKPGKGYDQKTQAQDVAALIQGLQLDRPVLIGHSMGADMVARVAADYPQLVRSIVLEDPPWRTPAEMTVQNRTAWMTDHLSRLQLYKRSSFEELLRINRERYPLWDETERKHWARAKQHVDPKVLEYFGENWMPHHGMVDRIHCPVLLLTADPALGGIVTEEVSRQLSTLWQGHCSTSRFPGVGHQIHRESFDSFYRDVNKFLLASQQGNETFRVWLNRIFKYKTKRR